MNRRSFLRAVAALTFAAASPAKAQGVDISRIDAYLRALSTARGTFRQTNPNGSVQTGQVYLSRPGRMRFEYDTPPGAMVIADGINVAVFDPKSTRVSQRYPLGRTPLALLLRADLSLSEPGLVRGAERGPDGMDITVVDPRAPDEGTLVLRFAEAPVALRQWTVVNRAGQRTAVALGPLETGVAFERSLFNIERAEIERR